MIDLTLLYSRKTEEIDIDGKYKIPCEYYKNSEILDLSEIEVKDGKIKSENDEYILTMNVKGKMKINDSVTLEEIWYPFDIEINEKLEEFVENNQNSLDIIEVLWQNIVVEVPLRYTLVKNYDEYQGDGWKLVSEEELVNNNNPLNTLLKDEDRSD